MALVQDTVTVEEANTIMANIRQMNNIKELPETESYNIISKNFEVEGGMRITLQFIDSKRVLYSINGY